MTSLSAQSFKIESLFGNGMVLQRDQPVLIWGWAEKKTTVSLEFEGTVYHTKARKNGRWEFELPAKSAGGPYTMKIWTAEEAHSFSDILFGDVWLCSGQSNMEWIVAESMNAFKEMGAADDPFIRHFDIPHGYADSPEEQLPGGAWAVCSPETVGQFSAVAYYFAREIRAEVKIPIGIINSTWGGSRIEPWMHGELLDISNMEEARAQVLKRVQKDYDATRKSLEAKLGPLPDQERGLQDNVAYWAASNLDETDWKSMDLPATWESNGYERLDGIVWFRKRFELSEADLEKKITLVLGRIDDTDITWVNGQKIGGLKEQWNTLRTYTVPRDVIKPGSNSIAIRVEDLGGGGGITGSLEELYVQIGDERRSLAGSWRFKVDAFRFGELYSPNKLPTVLYNKMIHPLHKLPIKGILWYQGESNADPQSTPLYAAQFKKMIQDWRERWDLGPIPFYFVQLAAFMPEDSFVPAQSDWADLLAAQAEALDLPNTAMAVATDLGDAEDIHPRNKQEVGRRLALAALNQVYDKDVFYQGPQLIGHKISGNKVELEFDHLVKGWMINDKYGYIRGFALAGTDGKFHWATAETVGNKIIVESFNVQATPTAVRYAWSNNPGDANLFNSEGLPLAPFQLDLK